MQLKEKTTWLMGRLQRTLFPCLEYCCIIALTEQEKSLVKILEIIEIEKHIPKSKQYTGRPAVERRAIGRSYVEKALFRYTHTRNLIHELQARPYLWVICGFPIQQKISSESTFSRAFAEFATRGLGQVVHDSMIREYLEHELINKKWRYYIEDNLFLKDIFAATNYRKRTG